MLNHPQMQIHFKDKKSKARQATSRAKQIEKIKIEDVKPSSRQNPFVRFDGEKKLHRLAVEVQGLAKAYDHTLFTKVDLMVEAGPTLARGFFAYPRWYS